MSDELNNAANAIKSGGKALFAGFALMLAALRNQAANALKVDQYEAYPTVIDDSVTEPDTETGRFATLQKENESLKAANKELETKNLSLKEDISGMEIIAGFLAFCTLGILLFTVVQPPKIKYVTQYQPGPTVTQTRTVYVESPNRGYVGDDITPMPTPKTSSIYPSPPANATASSSYTPTNSPVSGGYVGAGDITTPVVTPPTSPLACRTDSVMQTDGTWKKFVRC